MLRFPTINIDWLSFLLGFVAATLVWWILIGLRRIYQQARETRKLHKEAEAKTRLLSVKTKYFEQLLLWSQHQHLADSLFPLNDILIEPRFIPPPPAINPEKDYLMERLIDKIIPFNPFSTEVISQYNIKKITFPQAVQNGIDLAIVGKIGSGKTTALVSLLLKLITGKITSSEVINRIPIFAHAHQLRLSSDKEEFPLDGIIQKIISSFPSNNHDEAKHFFNSQLEESKILLLLDGIDELSSPEFISVIKKIQLIKQKYPQIVIITTIRSEQTFYISQLGFYPLFIANWDSIDAATFLSKWENNWKNSSLFSEKQTPLQEITPGIVDSWIKKDHKILSPMEWTLLLWGIKSNDIQSNRFPDLLEAFITRKIRNSKWLTSIGDIAEPMIQQGSTIISTANKDRLVNSGVEIDKLVQDRILVPLTDGEYHFFQPFILSYFATKTKWTPAGEILSSSDTSFYEQYLRTAVPLINNPEEFIQTTVSGIREANVQFVQPLERINKLSFSELPTRTIVPLFSLFTMDTIPIGTRLGLLTILRSFSDLSLSVLMDNLLSTASSNARCITALLLGSESGKTSERTLIELLSDPVLEVRGAACLALMKIGSANSLQTVVDQLLEGDDEIKRYAAEALTIDPVQGYDILKQTIHAPAISIRRASVQALASIPEDWVIELLTQISVEDDQWIIRDMAVQMLEFRQKADVYIPHRVPAAADASWLIQYASTKGMGVSRSELPYELLFEILKTGSLEEQLAVLDYLGDASRKDTQEQLEKKSRGPENLAREKAAFVLWQNSQRLAK